MEDEIGNIKNTVQMNVEISRGEKKDVTIPMMDFSSINHCVVFDENGASISIGELCSGKKVLLIFIRHFLCYTSIEYVEDLSLVSPDSLESTGVQLIVIGCAPWKFIKKFRENTNCPHRIFCDPDRKLHEILHLRIETYMGRPKESRHVKSGIITGLIRSTWLAWQSLEWQGDPAQQGGAMIIDADGRVLFSHRDERSMAHCSINRLLSEVGMEKINFPKDPQARIV